MTESGGIVTILFTDVVNSTEALTRLGDVRAEELRRLHFNDLREVIAGCGGREVKTLGDGFMVVFNSAVDAMHCAVGMQHATTGHKIDLRIGVHVGEPIQEGDDYFGTPVVVASRLCDRADPGQILTSDLIRALVGSRSEFAFKDVGPLALKGIESEVAACEVLWEPPVSQVFPLPAQLAGGERTPFVGRQDLLEELRLQWKEARDGHRALAALGGEPGIGKTRLAVEFAGRCYADGAIVLFGHADEEALLPYQPFVEALQHVVASAPADLLMALVAANGSELGRLLPTLRDRVADLAPPMRSDAESERFRLFDAAVHLITSLAAQVPVVLILDDLQWADRPTLLLLQHLFRSPTDAGVLVICTYRDTDLTPRHPLTETFADLRRVVRFERLSVGGLGEHDLEEFIDQVTGHEPAPAFTRALRDQTEGNPFYIGEVLRHLVESAGPLDVDHDSTAIVDGLGIPESVSEVIGRRLGRLSPDTNAVLIAGAVVGREFDLDVIERVTELGEDRVLEAIDEGLASRLVVEVPGSLTSYRFSHALVRETLYGAMSTARQVRMHRRVAEALEELHAGHLDSVLSQLAHHWLCSRTAGDIDRAVDYSRRAADAAMSQLAYEETVGHCERALEALEQSPAKNPTLRCDLLLALADAQRRAGNIVTGRSTYAAAIEAARPLDAERFAQAVLGYAHDGEIGTRDLEVIRLLEEASRRFGDTDGAEHALVLSRLSTAYYFYDRDKMSDAADKSLEMARRVGDRTAIGFALNAVFALSDGLENVERRIELSSESLRIGREINHAGVEHFARTLRCFALLERGDIDEFEAEVANAEALAAKVRLPALAWHAPLWRATLAAARGDLAGLERWSFQALELGQRAHAPAALQTFGIQQFVLRREQGSLGEVEGAVREMAEKYPLLPAWRLCLIVVLAEDGRAEEARVELDEVGAHGFRDYAYDANWPTAMGLIADAVFLTDARQHADAAFELLRPFEDRFVAVGQCAEWYGSISRLLGNLSSVMGEYERAIAYFERGIDADGLRGAVRMAIRGQWALAHTLLRRDGDGDTHRAAQIVADALPRADALGLIVLADRMRALRV
ncbi:MAG: AAA family ATPase [Actinobacteria bacterium]|nr:AAA family ATPase [Actinomycetota bacterium]